jgi:hypothetical protein
MPSPTYYRREAERCRRLAHSSKGTEAEGRWRGMADDYDRLAQELDHYPELVRVPTPVGVSAPSWLCGNDH